MFSYSQENVNLGLEYPGDTLPKTERGAVGVQMQSKCRFLGWGLIKYSGEEGRAKATPERVYLSRH